MGDLIERVRRIWRVRSLLGCRGRWSLLISRIGTFRLEEPKVAASVRGHVQVVAFPKKQKREK